MTILFLLLGIFVSYQSRCLLLYWEGEAYNPVITMIATIVAPTTGFYILKNKAQDFMISPRIKRSYFLFLLTLLLIFVTKALYEQTCVLEQSLLNTQASHLHDQYVGSLLFEGCLLWCTVLLLVYTFYETQGVSIVSYPLGLLLLSLPWEIYLQDYSEVLQVLGSDIAVYLLDLISYLFSLEINIEYWNDFTFYSDRFYLLINQSCSGVNLLTSMILYAWVYSWFMQFHPRKAIKITFYMLPACLFFNALRIASIFLLGHYGGKELAMGIWHEGTGYICQIILLGLWAYLFPVDMADANRCE